MANLNFKKKITYGPFPKDEKNDTVLNAAMDKANIETGSKNAQNRMIENAYKKQKTRQGSEESGGFTETAQTPKVPSAVFFDPNKDYTSSINEAIKNGAPRNYVASQFNQRNAKIDSDPSLEGYRYDQTYKNYMEYMGADNDISVQIEAAIKANAPVETIKRLLAEREYKIKNNPNLKEYLFDDVYNRAQNYIKENSEDEYVSKYAKNINAALNSIKNEKEFSYDYENDPLYKSYREQARQQGRVAMEDTLAALASSAGGMNSYAISAAQGVNNQYNQKIADKIPELYQLAMEKYLNEQNRRRSDIELYSGLDNNDYNRFYNERQRQDSLDERDYERQLDWYDREVQKEQYADELAQLAKQWEYQYARDAIEDEWRGKEWDYNIQNGEKTSMQNYVLSLVQNGVMPNPETIAAAGYNQDEIQKLYNRVIESLYGG